MRQHKPIKPQAEACRLEIYCDTNFRLTAHYIPAILGKSILPFLL